LPHGGARRACRAGFHRIRHYGLFAKASYADNIARGARTARWPNASQPMLM
jgi:hypothetical protein